MVNEARQPLLLARVGRAMQPPEHRNGKTLFGCDLGPAEMTARDALTIATRGGAEVLGRADIGHLAVGMCADPVSYTHLDVYKRQPHEFRDFEPVVGFVIENTVGNADRRNFPGPHETAALMCGIAQFDPCQALPGAVERRAAGRLHHTQARRPADEADALGDVEPLGERTGQGASPHLYEDCIRYTLR